jgi:CHAT domain-containing protein
MYAGAPQLIASLWDIDDRSTSAMMAEFYADLPTLAPARALRQAQLKLRDQYPHPFYWASFMAYGIY